MRRAGHESLSRETRSRGSARWRAGVARFAYTTRIRGHAAGHYRNAEQTNWQRPDHGGENGEGSSWPGHAKALRDFGCRTRAARAESGRRARGDASDQGLSRTVTVL